MCVCVCIEHLCWCDFHAESLGGACLEVASIVEHMLADYCSV